MFESLECYQNLPIQTTKYILLNSNKILEMYESLINSYVLDFFTCSHWDNLPQSWKLFFTNISPEDLQIFLNLEKLQSSRIMPLEIMCLRLLIKYLSISRKNVLTNAVNELLSNGKIEKVFWKHIKLKKRHEISSFAHIVNETAKTTNCKFVVDVGSGLGHLSRLLAYGYGLRMCSIEREEKFCLQARKLDDEFEKLATKHDKYFLKVKYRPVYLHDTLRFDINSDEFRKIITTVFESDVSFGIIGLHPCGDLGPALLKLYKSCSNIKFINIVGCCYMKLTPPSTANRLCGYPISEFSSNNKFHLSYNAKEIACHAIESYLERLRCGQHWQLKIHSYRAVIESLIVQDNPELKHSPLSNVKYVPDMTFIEYCNKALRKMDMQLNDKSLNSEQVKKFLNDWKLVVTFYSIRLLFAPLIESIILLDRYLYLSEETDGTCRLIVAFDPILSPRNHILSGVKRNAKS